MTEPEFKISIVHEPLKHVSDEKRGVGRTKEYCLYIWNIYYCWCLPLYIYFLEPPTFLQFQHFNTSCDKNKYVSMYISSCTIHYVLSYPVFTACVLSNCERWMAISRTTADGSIFLPNISLAINVWSMYLLGISMTMEGYLMIHLGDDLLSDSWSHLTNKIKKGIKCMYGKFVIHSNYRV